MDSYKPPPQAVRRSTAPPVVEADAFTLERPQRAVKRSFPANVTHLKFSIRRMVLSTTKPYISLSCSAKTGTTYLSGARCSLTACCASGVRFFGTEMTMRTR